MSAVMAGFFSEISVVSLISFFHSISIGGLYSFRLGRIPLLSYLVARVDSFHAIDADFKSGVDGNACLNTRATTWPNCEGSEPVL